MERREEEAARGAGGAGEGPGEDHPLNDDVLGAVGIDAIRAACVHACVCERCACAHASVRACLCVHGRQQPHGSVQWHTRLHGLTATESSLLSTAESCTQMSRPVKSIPAESA